MYKESSKRALNEQYGGEDESPMPNPGFTSPTLKLTKHSNAYMLVYVRESSWKDIMLEVSQDDIAEHVRARLKVPLYPLPLQIFIAHPAVQCLHACQDAAPFLEGHYGICVMASM